MKLKTVDLATYSVKTFWIVAWLFCAHSAIAAPGSYRISTDSKEISGTSLWVVSSEAHYSQPPIEVWNLLEDFQAHPKYIPRLKTCELLGVAHGSEQIYFAVDLPIPFPDVWNVIALVKDEKKRRLEWKMLEGNMKTNTGTLVVQEDGKGSRVSLEIQADMDVLLPKWVVMWGAKNFVPKVLKAIGDRLERGAEKLPKK